MSGPPVPQRPQFPDEYGFTTVVDQPGARLPWETVHGWLASARSYWIATTRPDGRPHTVPVWGLWLDDAILFSTGATTVTARNLAVEPRAVIHLESGDHVAIAEGVVVPVADRSILVRFAQAYERKYDWAVDPDEPPGPIFTLAPRMVLAWNTDEKLNETGTRWVFPAPDHPRPAGS